mgnify:CR=1 FL=1
MKVILDNLSSLSRFTNSIEGNGGNFKEYLAARVNGALPEFMIRIRTGNDEALTYFSKEADLRAFAAQNRDLRLFDEILTEEEIAASLEEGVGAGGCERVLPQVVVQAMQQLERQPQATIGAAAGGVAGHEIARTKYNRHCQKQKEYQQVQF